ncbi:MAG: hypothetical protein ACXABY_30565 [Candidatus Thorarchaeota archaeon]|jgi:hypothetical protein
MTPRVGLNIGDWFVAVACILTLWITTGQSWLLFGLFMVIGTVINVAILHYQAHRMKKGGF